MSSHRALLDRAARYRRSAKSGEHKEDAALICDLRFALQRLVCAAHDVYYAAHWTADRTAVDAVALWTELRDAADFEHGKSPKQSEEV